MKKFLIKMFTAGSGLSSKRVSGFIGWIVCLLICIYCTLLNMQAPSIIDTLFVCSTSLLGLDTLSKTFKESKNDKTKR